MFKHMDDDGSGKITYREFKGMVREELKLPRKSVPDIELQKVWVALDDDSSGFITPKEFGPFMKLGMPEKGPTWKQKKQAMMNAVAAATKLASATYGEREDFGGVTAAGDEELLDLSRRLNDAMKIIPDPHMCAAPCAIHTQWSRMSSACV